MPLVYIYIYINLGPSKCVLARAVTTQIIVVHNYPITDYYIYIILSVVLGPGMFDSDPFYHSNSQNIKSQYTSTWYVLDNLVVKSQKIFG